MNLNFESLQEEIIYFCLLIDSEIAATTKPKSIMISKIIQTFVIKLSINELISIR